MFKKTKDQSEKDFNMRKQWEDFYEGMGHNLEPLSEDIKAKVMEGFMGGFMQCFHLSMRSSKIAETEPEKAAKLMGEMLSQVDEYWTENIKTAIARDGADGLLKNLKRFGL